MTTTTRQSFEARCRRGDWECMSEPTRSGFAEVRVTATNKRRTVRVVG